MIKWNRYKKKMIVAGVVFTFIGAVAGCGEKQSISQPVEAATEENEQATGKVITPLPATLDINNLTDCTVPVSFEASDVTMENGSKLVITMKVYDAELFDLVDISQLQTGDTLVLQGKEIEVTAMETNTIGDITINGGLEEGGCCLRTDDSGVYYEVLWDDAKNYYELGTVTLPVGQDFEFVDSSDPDNPDKLMYAGDFLQEMADSDAIFSPNATTVTIQNGEITNLKVIFVP